VKGIPHNPPGERSRKKEPEPLPHKNKESVPIEDESREFTRKLIESEERFRVAAQAVTDIIWEFIPSTGKGSWFGDIERLIGCQPGEFPHTLEAWESLIHPDDHDRVMHAIQRAIDAGTPYDIEFRILARDGSIHYWHEKGTVLRNPDGTPRKMIGSTTDITRIHEFEEALIASEAKFRTIVNHSTDLILQIDEQGIPLFVSPSFSDLLGHPPDQILGHAPDSQVFDPAGLAQIRRGLGLLSQGIFPSSVMRSEITMTRKDGSKVVLEYQVSPIVKEGKSRGAYLFMRDITERKEIEESLSREKELLKEKVVERTQALARSEEMYTALAESAQDAIFIVGPDGITHYVNQYAAALFGNLPGALKGRYLHEIFPEPLASALLAVTQRVSSTGKLEHWQQETILPTGTRWFDTILTRLLLPDPDPGLVLGIAHDITPIREQELALSKSEAQFRGIFENAAEGILIADIPNGAFFHANPSICMMLGYSADELSRMSVRDIYHEKDLPLVWQAFETQARGGLSVLHEIPVVRKDGTTRFMDIKASRIIWDGKICSLGLFTDVTDQKAAREAIAARLEERSLLVREIQHRAGNNLQIIGSLLSHQIRQTRDTTALASLRVMQHRLQTMGFVYTQVQQYENFTEIDAGDYIAKIGRNLCQTVGPRKHITIGTDIHHITLDPDSAIPLGLLVNEVMGTVMESAFPGEREGHIHITMKESDDQYTLIITHDGLPLPVPFRIDAECPLEFQLVRSLVSQLHGTVEDDRSSGTKLVITLPKSEHAYQTAIEFLSHTIEDLSSFPLDGDIFAYIVTSLESMVPEGSVILVNSFSQDKKVVILEAFKGVDPYLAEIENLLGCPLEGIRFSVPEFWIPTIRTGECIEMSGGVSTLTFSAFPREICQKIENLPFFGRLFSVGISWKGDIYGAITIIVPPGHGLENSHIVSLYSRLIADYLQRRDAELALRQSEQRLLMALQAAEMGIWTWDLVTDERHVYTSGTSLFGLTEQELEEYFRDIEHRAHPDDRFLVDPASDPIKTPRSDVSQSFELRIHDKQGSWRTLLIQGSIVKKDSEGAPLLLMGTFQDITPRKLAEEEVARIAREWQQTFDATNDAIWILDKEQRIIRSNTAAERMFRRTSGELLGRHCWEVVHGTDRPIPGCPMVRMKSSLQREIMEFQVGDQWYEITVDPLLDAGGECAGAVHIISDITGRKAAEDAAKRSADNLTVLFDSIDEMVFILDMAGKMIRVNKAVRTRLGYTDDELIGRDVLFLHVPEGREEALRIVQGMIDGTIDSCPVPVLTKYGERIEVETKVTRGVWDSREVLIGVTRDVTQRILAEHALRESESRYRSFVQKFKGIAYLATTDWVPVFFHGAVQEITGYTEEEFVAGTPRWDQVIHPDDLEEIIRRDNDGLLHVPGYFVQREYRIIRKDGEIRWLLDVIQNRADDGGEILLSGILTDITERKIVEETLAQANKKLNLLSSITRHDIQNQLTVLMGFLDLSDQILDQPERIREFIDREKRAAATIEKQIAFTKDYENMGVKAPVWQNIRELIRRVSRDVSLRDVRLDIDIPDIEVLADLLLGKVFYNLVDNAIRHGGNQMSHITFTTCETNHALVLVCEDDGVGIPDEEKPHLFERGFGKGTGLGLFLAREILGITGMTIEETGVPGKGARFEITVPEGRYRIIADTN
jgi:PAS domain S-box-containing protein